MDLSVVIVNYNVKYFIEQCLHSVLKAGKQIAMEVLVVDNASVDGSCSMIKEKFPQVQLIENKENVGFSKANNQAIRIARGKYILLLNPDTVVDELCFEKVLSYANQHPEVGGIGVKMIDGKGKFLPESKRAFPSPSVSFYKIMGLSRLFPRSPIFARYHLGHLNENEIHEVEILAGAFMFLRKEALDKVGLLDESFFMYGEDIDLSYRIIQGGYKNYYLPDPAIIHYKGESTKKGSINYVMVFYQAMIIFAKKHFSSQKAGIYTAIIHFAIYLRAGLALFSRFLKTITLPLLDFLSLWGAYHLLLPWWEETYFEPSWYPPQFLMQIVPAYILSWIAWMYLYRAYSTPFKWNRLVRGLSVGTIFILAIYALLPEHLRFSRALILLGAGTAFILFTSLRQILRQVNLLGFRKKSQDRKRILLVAGPNEAERMKELLHQTRIRTDIVGLVSPDRNANDPANSLGSLDQLHEIVAINRIDELIFSGKDVRSEDIIRTMHVLSDINLDFKIAPPESISVIGSNSIDTAGELYVIDHNSIHKPENLRKKRLFDLISSLIILLTYPFWWIAFPSARKLLPHARKVLFGSHSWVSYFEQAGVNNEGLPTIKPGILPPANLSNHQSLSTIQMEHLNLLYSKDYRIQNDVLLLWKNLTGL